MNLLPWSESALTESALVLQRVRSTDSGLLESADKGLRVKRFKLRVTIVCALLPCQSAITALNISFSSTTTSGLQQEALKGY